jgi:Cu/Ag efflux pump CusA
MTMEGIRAELDRAVQIPGVTNVWIQPIKNRIDMLATGIKTPVGVKISGADLKVIETIGIAVEQPSPVLTAPPRPMLNARLAGALSRLTSTATRPRAI